MIAAFQGVPGAYSQLACRQLLGKQIKTLPCETFDAVFAAVKKGKAGIGIIPIENSLAGSIHQNYDLLLANDLTIVGETRLKVEHVLMCHPSTSLAKIVRVRSHPQALAQCSAFFEGGRVKAEPYFDTAGAAQSLAEESPGEVGAIASSLAAELYGLKVLKRNLQNHADNFTRFLAVVKDGGKGARGHAAPGSAAVRKALAKGGPRSKALKTSIAFIPAVNQVGTLFRALGAFSLRDIDLLKIESRPNPLRPFEYWFYLDFAGGVGEPKVDKALEHLREGAQSLKVLGSYPAAGR
jgi:prephenate dehydratase